MSVPFVSDELNVSLKTSIHPIISARVFTSVNSYGGNQQTYLPTSIWQQHKPENKLFFFWPDFLSRRFM